TDEVPDRVDGAERRPLLLRLLDPVFAEIGEARLERRLNGTDRVALGGADETHGVQGSSRPPAGIGDLCAHAWQRVDQSSRVALRSGRHHASMNEKGPRRSTG